jgi:4-nitrophenol 2-monooxygenase / 4-nitrocatechol 4-monooxygenase, reductase component
MSLDPDSYRSVLGRFATGVTVLTTTYGGGKDHGMTVSSFCSLSLTPPMVALCIDRQAEMHDLLAPGVRVIVNVLAAHQEMLSRRFADFEGTQRFDGIGFTRSTDGIPILDDVLAWLECDIVTRHEGGDHGLYIATVERATALEGMRPLLHYRGGYAQLER